MFSALYGTYFSFQMHFKKSSAICFNLDQSKILSSGNGLKSIFYFSLQESSILIVQLYLQGYTGQLNIHVYIDKPFFKTFSSLILQDFLNVRVPQGLCGKAASGLERILCGVHFSGAV